MSAARPVEAGERIGLARLEAGGEIVAGRSAASRAASARQGSFGSAEKAPASNMRKLASARPSERPITIAGRRVPIAPGRSRTGIEQHRDDREVEGGARLRRGIVPARALGELGPQVAAVDDEMPPARVERHRQRRIVLADHRRDEVGRRRQTIEIDVKWRSLPANPAASISCARSRTAAAVKSERAATRSSLSIWAMDVS